MTTCEIGREMQRDKERDQMHTWQWTSNKYATSETIVFRHIHHHKTKMTKSCMIYSSFIFLPFLPLLTGYHTIGNVKIEPLPTHSYRSLLTGDTYDLQEISQLNTRTIQRRSLDLACVHLDVHCVPDDNNVIDVFFGVSTAEECQLTCEYHSSDCVMFTWFDQLEETFPSSCFLYSR